MVAELQFQANVNYGTWSIDVRTMSIKIFEFGNMEMYTNF